jgi:hypothetical protein
MYTLAEGEMGPMHEVLSLGFLDFICRKTLKIVGYTVKKVTF